MPRIKDKAVPPSENQVLLMDMAKIITTLENYKPSKTPLQQEIIAKWLTQLNKINTEMQRMDKLENFSSRITKR